MKIAWMIVLFVATTALAQQSSRLLKKSLGRKGQKINRAQVA
jgi:hypothetical protein